MSWVPIPKKKYQQEKPKEKKKEKPKKEKLPTQMKSDKTRWTLHCPRLCQQKENGSYGKKTYDGFQCYACGYKR